jgi:superfamily II DNA or RNA helicase
MRLVVGRAREKGFVVNVVDQRVKPPGEIQAGWGEWLRPYQREAVDKMLARGRGIVMMPQGSGKTECFAALVQAVPVRWLIFVDTRDLMHQAAARIMLRTSERVGICGEGTWDPQRVTVVTLQTMLQGIGEGGKIDHLLASAQGIVSDESHVISADIFKTVAFATPNAWWRFGVSATPLEREDETDYCSIEVLGVLIHEVPPALLFELGVLARPTIWMVEYRHERMSGEFRAIYEAGVVLSDGRNSLVTKLASSRGLSPRPTLVFFKSLYHGRQLLKMIAPHASTEMVNGANNTYSRNSARKRLATGHTDVLCTSSLPYDEQLLVRGDVSGVQLMDIGELVDSRMLKEQWSVWTRLADGSDGWGKVSAGIKHPRNGVALVETALRGGARVISTDNHSLIRDDGSCAVPSVGERFCQATKAPLVGPVEQIDVCAAIPNRQEFELVVSGMTQARLRLMRSQVAFLRGKTFSDPRTNARAVRGIAAYGLSNEENVRVLTHFLGQIRYHKGKWRVDLPPTADDCAWAIQLGLTIKVQKRRGHSSLSLPVRLNVTKELARLAGMFVAEGCSVEHFPKNRKPHHSPARFSAFAALASVKPSTREGFKDKANIRRQFTDDAIASLGWVPRITPKQLVLDGSVPYVLFRHVLGVGGKSPQKQVPNFVWNSSREIQEAFLYGYFLGDGHRSARTISWTTVSRKLAIGTYYLLLGLGVNVSVGRDTRIHGHSKHRRYTVTTSTPLFGYKDVRVRKMGPRESSALVRYVRQEACTDEFVYDICVPGVERFYAGAGVLAHNTIFNKGVDIPDLLSGVNAAGGASAIDALQKVGRLMRVVPGKTRVRYWDILDRGNWHLEDHARKRMAAYQGRGYEMRVIGPGDVERVRHLPSEAA